MKTLIAALLVLLLPPLAIAETPRDGVLGPRWFQQSLVYHNAFEGKPDEASVTTQDIAHDLSARRGQLDAQRQTLQTMERGAFGRALSIRSGNAPFVLRGPACSPHRPLTLSFWWALPADMTIDGGFTLFELTGKGLISLFSRGKGEWSGLQRPAGVFQVYYFPGIQNVNGIYDFDLVAHLDLKANIWHHTAVVFRRGVTAQIFTDGQLVFETTNQGRVWAAADELQTLSFGGPLLLDEVAVLDRAVDAALIGEYYQGLAHLR